MGSARTAASGWSVRDVSRVTYQNGSSVSSAEKAVRLFKTHKFYRVVARSAAVVTTNVHKLLGDGTSAPRDQTLEADIPCPIGFFASQVVNEDNSFDNLSKGVWSFIRARMQNRGTVCIS